MSSRRYPYPDDEFDALAAETRPRGVHRRTRSAWVRWRAFVVVLVVFPLLAYALVTGLSRWDGLAGLDLPTVGDPAGDGSGDGAGGTGDDGADDPGETTDGSTPPESADGTGGAEGAEPTSEPPPEPEPVADLSRPVSVLNSTRITGLAGSGGEKLREAGFTSVTTGNWSGDAVSVSVVYYPTDDDVTTAQQVAATLGVTAVELSPTVATEGLVAVLAQDYQR